MKRITRRLVMGLSAHFKQKKKIEALLLEIELDKPSILLASDGRATLTATGTWINDSLGSEPHQTSWVGLKSKLIQNNRRINFEMHELLDFSELTAILALPVAFSKVNLLLPTQAPTWSFLSINGDDVSLLVCVNLAGETSKHLVQRVWHLAKGHEALRIKCWSSDHIRQATAMPLDMPLYLQFVAFSGSA